MLWSKPLDTQQAQALNPISVKHWFMLVKNHIVDAGILPSNIYGMDKSCLTPSDQETSHVSSRQGTKTQHRQGGDAR